MAEKSIESKEEAKISASVSSIYQRLLDKKEKDRAERKLAREERKRVQKEEAERVAKEQDLDPDEARYKMWVEALEGITGEELDPDEKKKKKKKRKLRYRVWADEDTVLQKPKKKKNKNYGKEFDPELRMLRTELANQNRFNADLQKRFANALGPATKDAVAPNKSMVDLAAVINSGHSNALGMIREVASIKKTIADLKMKQKKLDSEISKNGVSPEEANDLTLMGSSLMDSLFERVSQSTPQNFNQPPTAPTANQSQPVDNIPKFDPSTWEGPQLTNNFASYETVPHEVFVEINDRTGDRRYVAIESNSGKEITGCNIPTNDPKTLRYNEKTDTVTGVFGEAFRVRHV